jgi:hypothetical protein
MPPKLKKILKIILKIFILLAIISGIFFGSHAITFKSPTPIIYGTTFTYEYAQYLGLDPRKTFITILDDYKFRYIRIPVPWNMIEPEEDEEYRYAEIDWMMNEAEKRGARIILVVGEKTPRWPECHAPGWAKKLPIGERQSRLMRAVSGVVTRYRGHGALEAWQVENEPYLKFGECLPLDEKFFKQLIDTVKYFDPQHPVMVTDSGELSLWARSGQIGDWFGTTLYRVTWNKYLGYVDLKFIPASWYRLRLLWGKHDPKNSFVIELQGEPWIQNGTIMAATAAEKERSLSLEQFKKNIEFAEKTGFPRIYFWGTEWWVWMDQHGNRTFSSVVKELLAK